MKLDLTPCAKGNSKYIKSLNVRAKPIKLLKKNYKQNNNKIFCASKAAINRNDISHKMHDNVSELWHIKD